MSAPRRTRLSPKFIVFAPACLNIFRKCVKIATKEIFMGFFSRRKKTIEQPSATKDVSRPVTLIIEGERYARELLIALPQDAQAILSGAEEASSAFPYLKTDAPNTQPSGQYVLFADRFCRPSEQAVEFYKSLGNHNEDAILFPLHKQKYSVPETEDIPAFFEDSGNFLSFGCAIRHDLYTKLCKTNGRLPMPFLFAPALFAETIYFSKQSPFYRKAAPVPMTVDELRDLVIYFTNVKGTLAALQYKYGFDFICGKIVQAYALLAHNKDRDGLKDLDEFLKSECMALRVAAVQRAPLGFIGKLIRNNFETTFTVSAGIAWTLLKEKTE